MEMVLTGSLVHLSLHFLQYVYIRLLFVTKRALDTTPEVFIRLLFVTKRALDTTPEARGVQMSTT